MRHIADTLKKEEEVSAPAEHIWQVVSENKQMWSQEHVSAVHSICIDSLPSPTNPRTLLPLPVMKSGDKLLFSLSHFSKVTLSNILGMFAVCTNTKVKLLLFVLGGNDTLFYLVGRQSLPVISVKCHLSLQNQMELL